MNNIVQEALNISVVFRQTASLTLSGNELVGSGNDARYSEDLPGYLKELSKSVNMFIDADPKNRTTLVRSFIKMHKRALHG